MATLAKNMTMYARALCYLASFDGLGVCIYAGVG